jgi:hypothetical protein
MNRPLTIVRVVPRMTDADIELIIAKLESKVPFAVRGNESLRAFTRDIVHAVEDRFASSESHPLPPGKYDAVVTFTMPDSGVLQPWMLGITLKMQTVLLAALRGPDRNNPLVKRYTKFIRAVTIRNADRTTDFMLGEVTNFLPRIESVSFKNFLKGLEAQPMHFVMHLIHALEIIAYKHPTLPIASEALNHYGAICEALHLIVEPLEMLDTRLATVAEED